MKIFVLSIAVGISLQSQCVMCRSWAVVDTIHTMDNFSDAGQDYLLAEEARLMDISAQAPMLSPSYDRVPTTNRPSPAPSSSPSSSPSLHPSASPTFTPSESPTEDPFPESDFPDTLESSYFGYSPESPRGPRKWDEVGLPQKYYWDEFGDHGFDIWRGILSGHDLHRNFCNDGNSQSPIDLNVHHDGICHEHHEVRSIGGDYSVTGDNVEALIHSNKLRLQYRRRNCQDSENEECRIDDPPRADFPNGWPGFADVLHIDLKIPSEHTLRGKRFDAEMQIFHLHAPNKRIAAQSVLIEADASGHNYYFQEALKAFYRTFENNRERCRRRLQKDANNNSGEDGRLRDLASNLTDHRSLQFNGGRWDPHHPMLIPTIYFYRYDGSTTEPPCTEFVTWFVADEPMKISFEQLLMMKLMLFTNVDTECRQTSTHWDESVARPLQPVNGRSAHHCVPSDFGPDP